MVRESEAVCRRQQDADIGSSPFVHWSSMMLEAIVRVARRDSIRLESPLLLNIDCGCRLSESAQGPARAEQLVTPLFWYHLT
jgi:hypothetical protein